VTVFARRDEKRIVRLDAEGNETPVPRGELPAGGIYGRNQVCIDFAGDFREELVGMDSERGTLFVASNPEPSRCRALSPMEDFSYRHDRSQHASGYYIYICPPML